MFVRLNLCCYYDLQKKQPNWKKKVWPMQKRQYEKVVKSKGAAQKWLRWSDNGKFFNSNNSGKFVMPSPTGNRHQNLPKLLLLKILPLSDHHSHFWAATFNFTTFFMLPFFAWAAPFFLQFGCFCEDFTSFFNLTCICDLI